MKRLYIYPVLLTISAGIGSALAQSRPSLASLTINAQSPRAKSGSEMRLAITLKNSSDRDFSFTHRPGPDFAYEVQVVDSTGKAAAKSRFYREATDESPESLRGGSFIIDTLKPGQELHQEITLSRLYDLARPGEYEVHLAFVDAATKTRIVSNTIRITVVP